MTDSETLAPIFQAIREHPDARAAMLSIRTMMGLPADAPISFALLATLCEIPIASEARNLLAQYDLSRTSDYVSQKRPIYLSDVNNRTAF